MENNQNQSGMPTLEESWLNVLKPDFQSDYFEYIKSTLRKEKEAGNTIYPPGSQIFNAFNHTPLNNVKIVIIGQDPYHGPKQANGLSFSVRKGIKQPPSLQNIFKELQEELNISYPQHGDLTKWADQGVLLLNAVLTVRANEPRSHRGIGWEQFTNRVIQLVSEQKEGLVFLLWGKDAQEKAQLIDQDKHFILKTSHPSPYSANKGFFGSGHFQKANEILKSIGKEPIDWSLD